MSRRGATPAPLSRVGLFTAPVADRHAETPRAPGAAHAALVPPGEATLWVDGVVTTFSPEEYAANRQRSMADAVAKNLDWALVVTLRRRASAEISDRSEQARIEGRSLSEQDRRLMGRAVIRQIVRAHAERLNDEGAELWSIDHEEAYARAVENAIFGYGRLQPLFELPDVENIEIHGWDSVVVQHADGTRTQHAPVADSDEELVEAIRFFGEQARPTRPFDDAHPTMTLALGDRFRLHAIGFGLAYRPSVTIRQHTLVDVTLPDLVAGGMMSEEVGRYLHAAIRARKSMVISGDQGAGKTTLLRALIGAIPDHERFGTIETDYELLTHLQPNRRNILALQAKVGLGERQDGRPIGEYTVADLIPEALRQNLTRLVVGEVRGSEAAAMFTAMQSGAGSLSTTHSHSASSTMDRLASRVAQDGSIDVEEAYRQIAHNIDYLIHVTLVDDTWRGGTRRRFISEIRQLTGSIENDRPVTHVTYRAEPTAVDPAGFRPDPRSLAELTPFFSTWPGPERS
ncbi:CpaF family protein [Granulicoccus sp. GXG6511]|uniref:CpaF family protein n=1 Tax=Granulicoccus sp. GXG6511 TaxID=3381351 RepID=UPI003D7F1299